MNRLSASAGALLGGLAAAVAFAPAGWLAASVTQFSGGRLVLAEARGTVWSGSAIPVLAGGAGSRDAVALPGRLEWSIGFADGALAITLRQACCIDGTLALRVDPAWSGMRVALPASRGFVGQWPASWLGGLGTPWNTLQLGGDLRVATTGLQVRSVQGRWQFDGRADIDLVGVSSRLVTLPRVGSYRLVLQGDAATGDASLAISTREGPLQLSGRGQWAGGRLRLRGEARADTGAEAALGNLLNIIGRRQGPVSVISIG